jgi:hypothetical protein
MIGKKGHSQIGWIHFSREALRKAEARLKEEQEGVRDEIGFLLLHQAYADRFFPGTSVLHTRLRYIFFVPWLYLDLMQSFKGGDFARELIEREVELTRRLKHLKDEGVIGILSYPNPTSQPASLAYWSALGTWGFLRPLPDGTWPSRSAINRFLSSKRAMSRLVDDDGEPLDESWRIFVSIPKPPEIWNEEGGKLSFRLRRTEKDFVFKHLIALPRSMGNAEQSLLARLVDRRVSMADLGAPWEEATLDVASKEDRQALVSARRIAALSAIGRGVYHALVESALEHDGVETDRLHRDALKELVAEFQRDALKINVQEILNESPNLEGKRIINVLDATHGWLKKGGKNPGLLRGPYEVAELARKGPVRAKLPNTPLARERRREWSLNKGKKAEPLHYRWGNVRRLLMDLQGEP